MAVAEIDALLAEYTARGDAQLTGWRVRLAHAIERYAPPNSYYLEEAREAFTNIDTKACYRLSHALAQLREDYEKGYTRHFEELINASVFSDFLEMSQYLFDENFEIAAAVIAGSVLEEHLRKLAAKHGIALTSAKGRPRSVDELGIDLVKASAFAETRRKIIVGWYGQRTAAAHGNYGDVERDEVGRMIPGIREFIDNYPA
jgi:hypothetical protein